MEAFDPGTVFRSIDYGGRYAYGNQPAIAQWNLARLAETLLPLLDPAPEAAHAAAMQVLEAFAGRYQGYWLDGMRAKLGIADARDDDAALVGDLLELLRIQSVDFTSFFRSLSSYALGDVEPAHSLFMEPEALDAWAERWRTRLVSQAADLPAIARAMTGVNPAYIPRNEKVEEALAAATAGDMERFRTLLDVVRHPFDERPGLDEFAVPAPSSFAGAYCTFCGT